MPLAAHDGPRAEDGPVSAPGEDDGALVGALRDALFAIERDPARRAELASTPARAAKALRFLTSGYGTTLEEVTGGARFSADPGASSARAPAVALGPVVVRDIEIHSLCEHHLLPFSGRVHIAYLPAGPDGTQVLGLSKLARIADMYARRLQMQERLTHQIAGGVMAATGARGVAVRMECTHACMCMRGVQKGLSSTQTSAMCGVCAEDPAVREGVMAQLHSAGGDAPTMAGITAHSRL